MAQRDQGMRMLINHEQDEEDDDDDDDDDVDAADDGDDDEDDDDDDDEGAEDEDDEGEDEDENEDDDPLPAGNLPSGGLGGDQGGIEPWPAGVGGLESFRVSNGPAPCLFLAKARAILASAASFREKQKQQDLKPYLPRVFQHQHVQTPTPIFLNCKTQVPMMQQT